MIKFGRAGFNVLWACWVIFSLIFWVLMLFCYGVWIELFFWRPKGFEKWENGMVNAEGHETGKWSEPNTNTKRPENIACRSRSENKLKNLNGWIKRCGWTVNGDDTNHERSFDEWLRNYLRWQSYQGGMRFCFDFRFFRPVGSRSSLCADPMK